MEKQWVLFKGVLQRQRPLPGPRRPPAIPPQRHPKCLQSCSEAGVCLKGSRRPVSTLNLQRRASTHGQVYCWPRETTQNVNTKFTPNSKRIPERVKSVETPSAKAIRDLEKERHGLDGEMDQWYQSSAVYGDDETEEPPPPRQGPGPERPRQYIESTDPGFRVPHAWLGRTDQRRQTEAPNGLHQRPRRGMAASRS